MCDKADLLCQEVDFDVLDETHDNHTHKVHLRCPQEMRVRVTWFLKSELKSCLLSGPVFVPVDEHSCCIL